MPEMTDQDLTEQACRLDRGEGVHISSLADEEMRYAGTFREFGGPGADRSRTNAPATDSEPSGIPHAPRRQQVQRPQAHARRTPQAIPKPTPVLLLLPNVSTEVNEKAAPLCPKTRGGNRQTCNTPMFRDAEIFADGTCSGKLTWTCPICDIPTITQSDDYGDREDCGALD